jgi:hypothetical protein
VQQGRLATSEIAALVKKYAAAARQP